MSGEETMCLKTFCLCELAWEYTDGLIYQKMLRVVFSKWWNIV